MFRETVENDCLLIRMFVFVHTFCRRMAYEMEIMDNKNYILLSTHYLFKKQ